MKKKRQGFTLIELLAVIVILGLLMAIAIPSVTKYITQSRKKTVTTTIGNYIGALTNQVNDMEYIFTASNTVYAVPIECIALERGGTNPFGKWHQANNSYWAYVLVQYDDATSSYTYGFTFKDSAGYGLYPTTIEKLNESGSQINTGLNLSRPKNGTITNITDKENWTGFEVQDNTSLVVLEATSEGEAGNGTTTCTLCQKGKNYEKIENEKENSVINAPIHYGKRYSAFADDVIFSIIIHEDNSFEVFLSGFSQVKSASGDVQFIDNKIVVGGGEIATISEDKKELTMLISFDGFQGTLVLEETNNSASNATKTLGTLIKNNNSIITSAPTLTNSSNNTSDASGLYKSTNTNSGNATYYFRGNVNNNYVKFAGYTWRIIRINEDGTIKIMMEWGSDGQSFGSSSSNYNDMYYSNSTNVKPKLDLWYKDNISNMGYDSYVATTAFCEQAKVKVSSNHTSGSASMNVYTSYTPNFKCATDGNGKGIINSKIGLLTYDESIHAGYYPSKNNTNCYLSYSYMSWGMSPAGYFSTDSSSYVWSTTGDSLILNSSRLGIHPVISLNSNVLATGTGTSSDPYVVQTN